MLQIILCDDEKDSLKELEQLLSRTIPDVEYELHPYLDPESMLDDLAKEFYHPDLLIQDIVFEQKNGIEAGGAAIRLAPQCQIIFISSYDDYVSDVYAVRHCFFVRKSALQEYFPRAVETALRNLASRQTIHFKLQGESRTLNADRILYLERILHRTRIVTLDGESLCYAKPDELLQQADKMPFLRCHQSYWVNLFQADSLYGDSFVLKNGTSVPVSRSRKQPVRDSWYAFLHRQAFPHS